MDITKKELEKIVKELNDHYGEDCDLEVYKGRIALIRNYISDCPSWVGDMALVIGGLDCFKTILYRDSGTEDWYVKETINDGEYEEFSI